MGTHGETLLDARSTATAVLAGIGRWHGDHSTASICCFAFEDGPELCPTGIRDALGQVRVADQVGHLQVFQIDHCIALYQVERRLVVEVSPLPLDLLMLPGQPLHGLSAALAPLLAARHATLGLLERLLCSAVMARILNNTSVGRDQK